MSDNPNSGNQYDNPNQEVVDTDIISGDGNDSTDVVEPIDPDEPDEPETPDETPEEPETEPV